MKREKCEFVRYTASEGKSLKWTLKVYNSIEKRFEAREIYTLKTALIDESELIGDVVEVPEEECIEWMKAHPVCIGCM